MVQEHGRERGGAQRRRIDAGQQVQHGRVAGEDQGGQMRRRDAGLGQHLVQQRHERLLRDRLLQLPTIAGSLRQRLIRVSTLSPRFVWAFKAEAVPTTSPLARSTSSTTTVVVPTSMAAP